MPRILTVDDSASMRQLVEVTLTQAGFQVTAAVDGKDALQRAKTSPYNLVLTDLNMPNLDGVGLIRELRQLPAFRFTPILMLTTENAPERKAHGKAAGATGWIVKPFHPDQLIAAINRVLS